MQKKSIKSISALWMKKCDTLDIELIIAHVLKKDRIFVLTNPQFIITSDQLLKVNNLCQKRAKGYPLAYITGNQQFFGRDFIVNKNTLIPRPETELMIEKIISLILKKHLNNICIVDIGTGSGVIAITLAKECQKMNINFQIYATDISNDALVIAKQNTDLHRTTNKINFYHSDLLKNNLLQHDLKNKQYDYIIFAANLPYVDILTKTQLISKKESRALTFEPQTALWSNDMGLSHYKKLIVQTLFLQKNIISFYEIDSQQTDTLIQYIHKIIPFSATTQIYKDLAGKERIFQWTIHNKHKEL